MIATIVDTKALWETVVAAFVAGVGTTIVFSIAILGAARFGEATRNGDRARAAVSAAVAGLGFLATAVAVVAAMVVMTAK